MHAQPLIYLDSAATSQKPISVIEAITRFYAEEYGTVHRAVYELAAVSTAKYWAVRKKVQAFLGAAFPEEIIFTRGTTDAINLVAASFCKAYVRAGDEVIISQMEHHSNIVPWQLQCMERGAVLKAIPINERGELILEEYEKLLTDRTKLVSIAHIANSIGTLNPLEKIISMAHAKGAKVLVDGAQSAPHLLVDMQKLDTDFFVFSGHKAYGPTGVGILYGKREWLEKMPPYQGGGDMIEKVTLIESTYQSPPLRFEAGTPMIAEVIGLGAAIDYIELIGRDKIAAWEHQLLQKATQELFKIPSLQLIGTAAQKGAIISFIIPGLHPLDIGTLLDLRGVAVRTGHHCAQPTMQRFGIAATTRVSFGVYNTLEEVDQFIAALKEIISILK
jgi:cysteine desulfurase/selenocysteine lyase